MMVQLKQLGFKISSKWLIDHKDRSSTTLERKVHQFVCTRKICDDVVIVLIIKHIVGELVHEYCKIVMTPNLRRRFGGSYQDRCDADKMLIKVKDIIGEARIMN